MGRFGSRTIKVAVAAIAAVGLAAGAGSPVGATHAWGDYHWARTANPLTLKLGDNVNSVWDPYLVTTSSDWTQSGVLDTTIVKGSANPKNCRATAGMVQICNSTYGSNGWLGVAQIWVSGSHITQGTVKLNDTYFNTAKYNTSAWRNLVMCQEVGHTLGLNHQDEIFDNANLGSCMDYSNDPSTNQHPNQHDYDELATIYAHLDSTTTVNASTVSSRQPASWGRLVSGVARSGQVSVHVKKVRDQMVFTFVIWA